MLDIALTHPFNDLYSIDLDSIEQDFHAYLQLPEILFQTYTPKLLATYTEPNPIDKEAKIA